MLQLGGHIYLTDPRIAELGLVPDKPFPPVPFYIIYAPGPGQPYSVNPLPPPTHYQDGVVGKMDSLGSIMIDVPKIWPPTSDAPSTTVMLIQMTRGGVIFNAELARKIGENLLESHYGDGELNRQRPLIVTDKGDHWRVEGSWNHDQKIPGAGAFFLSIQKSDGRVIDLGRWLIPPPPPTAPPPIDTQST